MKTRDEIQELRKISIEGLLRYRGIYPTSKSGVWLMYNSPLREDHTASFGVNTTSNTFNDLGSGDHGDIVQLVRQLEKIKFADACTILEGFASEKKIEFEEKNLFLFTCKTSESTTQDYQITAVKDLQHPALLRYVESRKISFQNAFKYLHEIHYTNAKGKFFGVGYQNDIGNYVVRSEIMKKPINLGKAGIKTFAVPNAKNVAVFEGMFDFLSACEFYKGCPTITAIILNSTSNLNKALPIIRQYEKVFCYFDNDDAGRKATQKMINAGLNVLDKSNIYAVYGFKDFNEFLVNNHN